MNTTDRRVQRTQKYLLEALIALSQQRSYEDISLRDITDHANIAYSTFFRHYADKDALLVDTVNETAAAFIRLIRQLPQHTPGEEGILLFQHVHDNEALYRLIFNSQGTNRVIMQIQTQIEAEMILLYKAEPNSVIPVEILTHHIITSVLELIKWWLAHNQPYPVERMAEIYRLLIVEVAEHAAYGRFIR